MRTAQPVIVTATDDVTLLYHPDQGIVHHIIQRPVTGQAFRDLMTCGADILHENRAEKWLSDDRKNNNPLLPEDTAWGSEVWFPQTLAAGWKYWALVVPSDLQAQMSLMYWVQNFSMGGIRVMVFVDPAEAFRWLTSM